jgi:hypothetical protein
MTNNPTKKFINLRELSQLYSIPLTTLRRWASERRFPIYKLSNRIFVSEMEWEKYISDFHINPPDTQRVDTV